MSIYFFVKRRHWGENIAIRMNELCVNESYMLPLVQVGQVDLAVGIYVFAGLDHHRTGGLHKTYRRIVGIRIQQPQAHGNIVHVS